MTKVNYFEIVGTRNGKEEKVYHYGRSKTEAGDIAKNQGIEFTDVRLAVKEMKLSEMLGIFDAAKLLTLRNDDKKLWKVNTQAQAIKTKAAKVSKA